MPPGLFRGYSNPQQAQTIKDLQAQIDANNKAQAQMQASPGYEALTPNQFETQAGVTPPGFRGTTDVNTGALLDQYKLNPFESPEEQALRARANAVGPSDIARGQLTQQGFEEANQMGAAGLQSQQAQDQARAQLMQQGGLGGGARTSLARQGMRNQLMANQGVRSGGVQSRYNINQADAQNKQQLLGQVADVTRQADLQNINNNQAGLAARAQFDANRYNQQMQAWGAKQSADATRAAGSGGGKK